MYSSRTTILALFLTIAVLTTASAQVAHVLSPAVVGRTTNAYLPSPAYVAGAPGGTDQLPYFWSAGHPMPFLGGGIAMNQITRRVWSSDGQKIWEESMQEFPPLAAPAPVAVAPVLLAGPNSPRLTGMSVDPTGKRLFICDAVSFGVFDPVYPYPAIALPVMLPAPHSQFTGIAYDPSDDTLWLCDIQGGVYHVDITGAAIAGEYPINFIPALLTGICVDRSAGPGAWPTTMPPTVAGGLPGMRPRVWVTDGANVHEAIGGSVTIGLGTPATAYGMAFSADGQFSYGGSGGSTQPFIRQDRPSANGFGLGTQILMETTPPLAGQNQLVVLFYGWYPITGGPALLGGTRRLPASVAPIIFPVTNLGKESVFIPDLPAGLSLSFQYGTVNYGGGLAFSLAISDCLTFMSARP